jgi:hypothetical protein
MRSRSSLIAVALVAAGALDAACSGSSAPSVSVDQGTTALSNALCDKVNTCSAFLTQLAYGDVATCQSRLKASLAAAAAASGSGWTGSNLEACAQALPAVSCDDALGHNIPVPCRTPSGQLATGAACGDNSQCSSGYCNLGPGGKCGTCAAGLGAAGAGCYRDDDCAYGTLCVGNDVTASPAKQGKCTGLGASGATCDDLHPCEKTLSCNAGVCATPAAAGAACSQTGSDFFGSCNELAGDYCNKVTNGVCAAFSVAGSGQQCGGINGGITVCAKSDGKCPTAAGAATATCGDPAMDFGNCNAKTGPFCLSPAQCIGGVCTIPTPGSCH